MVRKDYNWQILLWIKGYIVSTGQERVEDGTMWPNY